MQFSIRTLFIVVAVVGIVFWLYRLGPPMIFALAAFLVLVVLPILLVGQPDAAKIITSYVATILCFGGLCFLIADLVLTYW